MHQLIIIGYTFSHPYTALSGRINSKGKMFGFSVHSDVDFWWEKEGYYNCHHRE